MKTVKLMEMLAKAVEKNPKVDAYIVIRKKDVEKLNLDKIEDTEFFELDINSVPQEDLLMLLLHS